MWDAENPNPDDAPFLHQPHHPEGRPWADHDEVDAWALLLIDVYEGRAEFPKPEVTIVEVPVND